jgi:hypothetical protein
MRESGYFLPHVPIGYAFTVLASLGSWPILRYVFGIRNATLLLSIMVAVAVLWLAIDLTLHPPASEDFESRGRNE